MPKKLFKKGHIPWITGKTHSQETRELLRLSSLGRKHPENINNPQTFKEGHQPWNKGKRLSIEHKQKLKKPHLTYRGANNHAWKDGITPLNQKIRNSKLHKDWANSVYKKNNFICQICFIKCQSQNIVAHHLKSFSDFPEFRFDIENGITLCRVCHLNIHRGRVCLT